MCITVGMLRGRLETRFVFGEGLISLLLLAGMLRAGPALARPGPGPGRARLENCRAGPGSETEQIVFFCEILDFLKNRRKRSFSDVFDPFRCENRVRHVKIIQNDLFKPGFHLSFDI